MKSEIFISVVVPLDTIELDAIENIKRIHNLIESDFHDFELIVVDGSESTEINFSLYNITHTIGLKNTQCLVLDRAYDIDTLSCIGIENSIGDYIVVLDVFSQNFEFLINNSRFINDGYDIVYFFNKNNYSYRLIYVCCETIFNVLFYISNKNQRIIRRGNNRIISRTAATWLLAQRNCVISYRSEPKFSPLKSKVIEIDIPFTKKGVRYYLVNLERATRILLTASQNLLRYVSLLMLLAAIFNIFYSIYAVFIAIVNPNVAPGWASLSLQFSTMFFMFALVFFILSEYLLHYMPRFGALSYQVIQNYISKNIFHGDRPNIFR